MFNVGLPEIAVILVVALLIFGPDRLPRAVQQVAGGVRRLRGVATDATRSLQDAAGLEPSGARQALDGLADLHPRRFVSSILDDPAPAQRAPQRPTPRPGATPTSLPATPDVDFDPDAP